MATAPSNRPMRSHTDQTFEAELRQLKDLLLSMGGRCEKMIADAVRALETTDSALAQEVMKADKTMNDDELAVDDLAVRILALRQPVGRDLRFAVAAVKVVTDLERIGDEAVNIAERAQEMMHTEEVARVGRLARVAASVLHDALNSFVKEDPASAREAMKQEDEVDRLYGEVFRFAIAYMKDPTKIEDGMRIANCAKYLERIGDHANNIAEMVIYLAEGVDIRHGHHA